MTADLGKITKKTARFGGACARFGASRFGFVPQDRDSKLAGSGEENYYVHREADPTNDPEHEEVNP